MLPRLFFLIAALSSSMSVQATLIDFTHISWDTAINTGGGTTATIGNVTLTSSRRNLTFNGSESEQSGCAAGKVKHGLKCDGDGIGIKDDEITHGRHGRYEKLTISFVEPVNINNLLLLDLFGNERRRGERAIINGSSYQALPDNDGFPGGFYATGFSAQGITSIMLTAGKDRFSDYALAAIDVSPVPLPGAFVLFASALLGLFGFRRFT